MNDRNDDSPAVEEHGLPGRVLGRLVGSVVSPIVDSVDPDEVLDRIDVNQLVERLDIGAVLNRVDVNATLDRVDPDRLIGRVDVNTLMERVDVNATLDRVDPDRLIGRVDINALMERVDVNTLIERTELGGIIARSTTGVFTELLDLARTLAISLDQVVQGVPARMLRGASSEAPATPSDPHDVADLRSMSTSDRAVTLQRHFSGSVSRFLAFVVDQFTMGGLFVLAQILFASAVQVVIGNDVALQDHRLVYGLAFVGWAFTYTAGSLAASGKTIGKALLGLLVVDNNGGDLTPARAVARTLCFPLSFVLFGVGFLVGLVRRDRRELHDLLCGTSVVYAWDASTARLREEAATPPQSP